MQNSRTRTNQHSVAAGENASAQGVDSAQVQQLRKQGGYQAQQEGLKPSVPVQFLDQNGSNTSVSAASSGSNAGGAGVTTPAPPTNLPGMTGNPAHDQLVVQWWDELNQTGKGEASLRKATQGVLSEAVYNFIQRGRNEVEHGPIWQNSCEWLLKMGKIMVLMPTHDAPWRQWITQKNLLPQFSNAVYAPSAGDYNENDITDQTGVFFIPENVLGYRNSSGVGITEKGINNVEMLRYTIIHEVQHDADNHENSVQGAYQTEFNALWLFEGDLSTFTLGQPASALPGSAVKGITVDGHSLDGFDNARQQAIFQFLHPNTKAYGYVAKMWATKPGRQFIEKMTLPVSGNPINSVRLQTLYQATEDYMNEQDQDRVAEIQSVILRGHMENVLRAEAALNDMDRDILKGNQTAAYWDARLSPLLYGNAHLDLQAKIKKTFQIS